MMLSTTNAQTVSDHSISNKKVTIELKNCWIWLKPFDTIY